MTDGGRVATVSAAAIPGRACARLNRAMWGLLGLGVAWSSNPAGGAEQAGLVGSATYDLREPVVLTQVPARRPPQERPDPAEWFAGARVVLVTPDRQVRVLSEGFHSAGDPDVSFDGKHVLFAGKKGVSDRWRIWEIGVDGRGLRPVSPEGLAARSPIYVSTLFTLDSPEPWTTLVFVGQENTLSEAGRPRVSSLYNVKLDGTELRRLTYNPNLNFDPIQMWDGRLVYCAERFPNEPGGRPPRTGLYAIHIEGADMELYGGEEGGARQQMPCSLPLDRVAFIEPEAGAADGAGHLAWVTERRPHTTYGRLKQDAEHLYLFPSFLSEGRVLISRRSVSPESESGLFCLNLLSELAEVVFDAPEYHDVQGKLVTVRQRPDGHSTVVEGRFDTGTFYGLNAYDSDQRLSQHLKPGTVKRVRFIEGVVQAAADELKTPQLPPFVARRLIGEAPVETDGSFNVEVPADVPFLLQTLDDRGLALATCGWIWVKPKETRGCIGCHEDPERTPENDYVLALRRPSTRLTLTPEQRRSLGFRENIAPLLAKNCAATDCHGGNKTDLVLPLGATPVADTDLRRAYETLMKGIDDQRNGSWPQPGRYVDPGRARTSWLVWQVTGTNTSRPWDAAAQPGGDRSRKVELMPPSGKGNPLTAEAMRTIIQWIDIGAPYEAVKPRASVAATRPSETK